MVIMSKLIAILIFLLVLRFLYKKLSPPPKSVFGNGATHPSDPHQASFNNLNKNEASDGDFKDVTHEEKANDRE